METTIIAPSTRIIDPLIVIFAPVTKILAGVVGLASPLMIQHRRRGTSSLLPLAFLEDPLHAVDPTSLLHRLLSGPQVETTDLEVVAAMAGPK